MADFIVRFLRPTDWAEPVLIYTWGPGSGRKESVWPGVPMAADTKAPGWYQFRLTDVPRVQLLFHDDQGHQSPDLERSRDGWFSIDMGWTDALPNVESPDPPSDPPLDPPPVQSVADLEPRPLTERTDFREETIYFLLTTRFYDGDPFQQLLLP